MKRTKFYLTLSGGLYSPVLGYQIDDGLLAVFKEDGEWVIHHIPTGLRLGGPVKSYRVAKLYAQRIRATTCFDWSSTEPRTFLAPEVDMGQLMVHVGNGDMTPEELAIYLMERKLKEE